jgi:GWxTD domain-containing protein
VIRILAAAWIALAAAGAVLPTEAEKIKALPEEERRWLTEFVAPIILPEERKAFLELTEAYQREAFKESFWERRERDGLPRPLGPRYRQRYAELRKLADEKYDGWNQDAGRMVLRWGEPDSIFTPKCAAEEVFFDIEVWEYGQGMGAASGRHIFYRPADLAPRKLWTVADEMGGSLRTTKFRTFEPPIRPNSCRLTMASLLADCDVGTKFCPSCPDFCELYRAYRAIRLRQGSEAGSAAELGKLFEAPAISTEGLDRQKDRWAGTSNPNAKPLRVESSAISATPSTAAAASVAAPAATPTPESIRDLSDEEIRERLLALERPYREWLDYATPLLTREQLSRFLQLSSAEKDRFIREFWKKRK